MKKRIGVGRPRLVEVEWVDSMNWKPGWDGIEDVVQHYREAGQDTIRTLGYIIDRTAEYLLLAGDLQFTADHSIPRGNRLFSIPTGCVKRIRHLRVIGAPL